MSDTEGKVSTSLPEPFGQAPERLAASHAAVRSVSAIALNQVAQAAGGLLFVALVPRTLQADVYGQLAFAFALITILHSCGDLGYQEIFSRFLPEVRRSLGAGGVRAMTRRLFAVRLFAGLVLGLAGMLVARLAASWLTGPQLALMGVSVAARVWSMGPFPLLLGLGQTFKWSVESGWRQIVLTLLVLWLVPTPSLTLALLALTTSELFFLFIGLWWVRAWLAGRTPDIGGRKPGERAGSALPSAAYFPPPTVALLRFGFTFSLANLALVILFRISPIAVDKLTGSHPETAFFDLAQSGLLLLYTLMVQVAYAFVPILTQLQLEQRPREAEAWLGRVVRYSAMLVALAAGGMWAVATPLAPILFGPGFGQAAGSIRMMGFGLLSLPLASAGVLLTAVDKRPGRKVWAALAGIAVFIVAAVLMRGQAAAGIALAFALALAGYAAGFGSSALQALRAGGAGGALAAAATLLFVPLFFTRFDSLLVALAAWASLAVVYSGLMLLARAVSVRELRLFLQTMRR